MKRVALELQPFYWGQITLLYSLLNKKDVPYNALSGKLNNGKPFYVYGIKPRIEQVHWKISFIFSSYITALFLAYPLLNISIGIK